MYKSLIAFSKFKLLFKGMFNVSNWMYVKGAYN